MQTDKKVVLVDMDGVLADFQESMVRLGFELTGLKPGNSEAWHSEKGFPKEKQKEVFMTCLNPGFFENLKPMKGAIKAFKEMFAHPKLDVFICTAPMQDYEHCVLEKFHWVEEHLGRPVTNRTLLMRDKTLVHGDVLIDDRPFIHGVNKKPTWKHIYFDHLYNRPENEGQEGIPRLDWSNWKEVLSKELDIEL